MRRWAFYLAVALLAFGIGSFVVSNFYWREKSKPIVYPATSEVKIDATKPTLAFTEENKVTPKQKTKFICTGKILSTVWKRIKIGDFAEWENAALNDGKENCSEIIYVMEKIDLNNDGVKEIIVGGKHWLVNGATGNCGTWICQKVGKRYKVIFEGSAEDYVIKKSVTNGYRDVFIKYHQSCCSSDQITYKFDRNKYKESKCLFVDYGTTGKKFVTTCTEETARINAESRKIKNGSSN